MCKVDIEKAYNHTSYFILIGSFKVDEIRGEMDWLDKIVHLNNKVFILVEGKPTGFLQNTRGLYMIATEAFSCLLKKAAHRGYLSRW